MIKCMLLNLRITIAMIIAANDATSLKSCDSVILAKVQKVPSNIKCLFKRIILVKFRFLKICMQIIFPPMICSAYKLHKHL